MHCAEECVWWYGDDDDDEGDFVGGGIEKKSSFVCVCERERGSMDFFFSLLDPGFNSNEIMTEADATCYTRTVGGTYLLIVVLCTLHRSLAQTWPIGRILLKVGIARNDAPGR